MLRSWSRISLAALATAAFVAVAQAQSLTTTFNDNNGQDGNMFNVINVGASDLTITSLDVHFDNFNAGTLTVGCGGGTGGPNCTQVEVEVYRTNNGETYKNNEEIPGLWTMLGNVQHTYTTGNGVPQPLNMPLSVVLNAPGGTIVRYGMYVTNTGDVNTLTNEANEFINYTNGVGNPGNKVYQNADMKIVTGVGLDYPFNQAGIFAIFSPRVWNGTIYYTTAGGCNSNASSYCTPGTSAAGCVANLSSTGTSSATAATGFVVSAANTEGGNKSGLVYWGTAQKNPATSVGTSNSFQCVNPPVKRSQLLSGGGTNGVCDGSFSVDLNARWTAQPAQNPGAGATMYAQLWYRDPGNTSNQTTSRSDGLTWTVCP